MIMCCIVDTGTFPTTTTSLEANTTISPLAGDTMLKTPDESDEFVIPAVAAALVAACSLFLSLVVAFTVTVVVARSVMTLSMVSALRVSVQIRCFNHALGDKGSYKQYMHRQKAGVKTGNQTNLPIGNCYTDLQVVVTNYNWQAKRAQLQMINQYYISMLFDSTYVK